MNNSLFYLNAILCSLPHDFQKVTKHTRIVCADDKNVHRNIRRTTDCPLLHRDLDSLQRYHSPNKITSISFIPEINRIPFRYNFSGIVIERVVRGVGKNMVRDVGVFIL